MDATTAILMAKMIGGGLAAIGILGGGVGIGLVFLGSQQAIARNPELQGPLTTNMYIGMGMCELTSILALVMGFMIMFVLK
jgi:F0F1-type ATP synthase membrane subunit c/vacuolar-type H+-ATPase subunit K